MSDGLNEGVVGDAAKLMMHRLIVRRLRRDPSLVDKAKVAHARQAAQFADWPFVREWQHLLALPAGELALKLISRDREMVRLRNSSPFYLAEGVHFGDYDMRNSFAKGSEKGRPARLKCASDPFPYGTLMSQDKKLRTFDDLLRVVRALAYEFKTDTVFVVGSQAILASMPDAPEAAERVAGNRCFPPECEDLGSRGSQAYSRRRASNRVGTH